MAEVKSATTINQSCDGLLLLLNDQEVTNCVRTDVTWLSELCWRWLTIIGNIWNLEAFATVTLIGLKLNPELARTRGEGDGSFICLTRLIGGDGGWMGLRKRTNMLEQYSTLCGFSRTKISFCSLTLVWISRWVLKLLAFPPWLGFFL